MSPILAFQASGFEVSVYSPAGGKIPIDEASMNAPFRTEEVDKFLEDGGESVAQPFPSVGSWEACVDCPVPVHFSGSALFSLPVQQFRFQQLL